MRTTVTLDPDVERLLRHAMLKSQKNFKTALNDGLRRGLAHLAPAVAAAPFVVKARPWACAPTWILHGCMISPIISKPRLSLSRPTNFARG